MEKHRPPEIVRNLTGDKINFLVRGEFNKDIGKYVRADKTIHRADTLKKAEAFVKKLLKEQ